MSNAFPFAIPLAISTKTILPKFFIALNRAIVPPIFPAPINDILRPSRKENVIGNARPVGNARRRHDIACNLPLQGPHFLGTCPRWPQAGV